MFLPAAAAGAHAHVLPPELLGNTFSIAAATLYRRAALELRLVSKTVNAFITPVLFKTVVLDTKQ